MKLFTNILKSNRSVLDQPELFNFNPINIKRSTSECLNRDGRQYLNKITYNNETVIDTMSKGTIKYHKCQGVALSDMYVSTSAIGERIKPNTLRFLANNVKNIANNFIGDYDELPKCVVLSAGEMGRTVAAYSAEKNVLYLSSALKSKQDVINMQNGFAASEDYRSTFLHELIHWKDAEDYRKIHGNILDQRAYLIRLRGEHKKKLDDSGIDMMNVSEISKYAKNQYFIGNFDETYTEYRVKKALEEIR